jgi:hypothetical protein
MKVLLDIPDDQSSFFLKVLANFSFVKVKPLSDEKAQAMEDLKEAVEEVKQHKQGKIKLKSARELLDEL